MDRMMRVRFMFIAIGMLLAPVAAGAGPGDKAASLSPLDCWSPFIVEASRRFGIPGSWIRAVIGSESGGQVVLGDQHVTSRAGAMGLMQLMPQTWMELHGRLGLGIDAFDPHDNILAGTAYLRALYERYGYPGLFAAYNAGPARFDDYLFGARPLPAETIAYLATLDRFAIEAVQALAVPSGNNLFFSLRTAADRPPDRGLEVKSGALFVSLINGREPRL